MLSVIRILSEEVYGQYKDYYFTENNPYIDKIKEYFNNYKNHEAVNKCKEFGINNPQIMKYSFENNGLSLNDRQDDSVNNYYSILNDFVDKSNFYKFYLDMNKYYNEYTNELKEMNNLGFVYIFDISKILEENNFYDSMNLIKEYLNNKSKSIQNVR